MGSVVQSLEASFFVQMTEDEEKIRWAVSDLLGRELTEQREDAEGHFGNTIVWIQYHATGEDAEAAFKSIVARIEGADRRAILSDIEASLDERNALYLRLSKQVLIMSGKAVLAASDPIRIRVKPRSYMVRGDPAGLYARLFEVDM